VCSGLNSSLTLITLGYKWNSWKGFNLWVSPIKFPCAIWNHIRIQTDVIGKLSLAITMTTTQQREETTAHLKLNSISVKLLLLLLLVNIAVRIILFYSPLIFIVKRNVWTIIYIIGFYNWNGLLILFVNYCQ